MNNWQYHDRKMQELKKLYTKISKQTQNRLQGIFSSFNFTADNFYNIVDAKTKSRINTYIEEWKEKGLLKGYFGVLANNIYKRSRVKNSEILELLIYGAYIEEQSKLDKYEKQVMYEDANYYYQQGQVEVNNTLPKNKRKIVSVIPDAIFLALLDMANAKGYMWNQYIEAIIKYNADQIYRQAIIDIQQQKDLDITNDIYQNIIKRQSNSRLNVNGDKISGDIDLTLIGINNKAKLEGIYSFDDKAKVRFCGINDEKQTDMCKSLDGQEFYIHDWNEFYRYSKTNDSIVKYRCYGLVLGLNLPPINDGFHWCRSYIIYLPIIIENTVFNERDNIIIDEIKILENKELNKINRTALLKNIKNAQKVKKDFPILDNTNIKYKIIDEKDNTAMFVQPTQNGKYILGINKNIFNKDIKNFYNNGTKKHDNPKGTTYKDIYTHEIGHIINFEIIKKVNKGNLKAMQFDYDNNITSNNIIEKAFNNLEIYDTIKKEKMIKNISNYALTDSSETIGEAFMDYYSNNKNARTLSKEIVRVMKGMIKN